MADHFLDTETRHDLALTALRCLEAGLTVREAEVVWCHEVSPAVAFNLWIVAGEWAGWPRDWLVERIERRRGRWDNAPGIARGLRYRLRAGCMHGVWVAIARHMQLLLLQEPRARVVAADDLAWLARHAFDFCPPDPHALPRGALDRLRALYPEPFLHAIRPALVGGEDDLASRRVEAALTWATSGPPPHEPVAIPRPPPRRP